MILKLNDKSFDGLFDGTKVVTIRKGRIDIPLGINKMESASDNTHIKEIEVYQVVYMHLKFIPDTVAQDDGYENSEEMFEGLLKFYPDLTLEDEVTIIYFNS